MKNESAFTVRIANLRLVSEANQREHWSKKAKRVQTQKGIVTAFVRTAWATKKNVAPRFPLDVTITRIAPRSLDEDNLAGACKAVQDAIANVFGIDDRDAERVRYLREQRKGKPNEYAVEIAIAKRAAVAGAA